MESEGAMPSVDCPDTLQDLCIFYLMNNLDVLVPSLDKVKEKNEEFLSSFSLLHGNKMLGYFNRCCLPCEYERPYVYRLMDNFYHVDEISVSSTKPLRASDTQRLADSCKSVKNLHLTCFEDNLQILAFRTLVVNNLDHLTTFHLSQKCEECLTFGFLNLLRAEDFDADVDSSDDDMDSDDKSEQATVSKVQKTEDDNTKEEEEKTAEVEEDTSLAKGVPNLKSFSYLQIYTSVHPNLLPCRNFGWFYEILSKILISNKNLQSFTLCTLISNPIEWFLSQPDLPKFTDLQSLILSFDYFEDYAAGTEELKIPFSDKFFTNLPLLKNLKHLDISCSVTTEDDMSDFRYSQDDVERFKQAIKEMPQLKSLDISGTNLADIICHKEKEDKTCRDHCMPGFEGRQFDFLGLYGTEACKHKFIPASRVSGNASIEQLIEALTSLRHNMMLTSAVIQDIRVWINQHSVSSKTGLTLIDCFIVYMSRVGEWCSSRAESEEYEEKPVSIVLECINHLVSDYEVYRLLTVKKKRLLMEQLLNVCENVSAEFSWRKMNTGMQATKIVEMFLSLIPRLENIVMYSYRFGQYIQVLLGIYQSTVETSHKIVALELIYSACIKSLEYKFIAGTKLELVKILLQDSIREYNFHSEFSLRKRHIVWNILCTLTDHVQNNCKLFVDNKGCEFFVLSFNDCQENKNLCRVFTQTLVNVSLNPGLVAKLMTKDIVQAFWLLLIDEQMDNEVRSNAVKFLTVLKSHGPKTWPLTVPSRGKFLEVLECVSLKLESENQQR